jgi:hypothetical protein
MVVKSKIAKTKELSLPSAQKATHPLVEQAEAIVIKTEQDKTAASEILSKLNQIGDAAEEEKNKVMRPALDVVAAERKRWKPLEDMIGGGVALIRKKLGAYQTEQKRIADEAAAKIASRVGTGAGKLKAETAIKQIGNIEKPTGKVAVASGSVEFMTVKKFRVVALGSLPEEYLLANETAIRDAMRKGIEVAGVEYYEEQVPKNIR